MIYVLKWPCQKMTFIGEKSETEKAQLWLMPSCLQAALGHLLMFATARASRIPTFPKNDEYPHGNSYFFTPAQIVRWKDFYSQKEISVVCIYCSRTSGGGAKISRDNERLLQMASHPMDFHKNTLGSGKVLFSLSRIPS